LPAGSIALHVCHSHPRVQNELLLRDQFVLDSPQELRDALRAFITELTVSVLL
jgi:hypothetical protein